MPLLQLLHTESSAAVAAAAVLQMHTVEGEAWRWRVVGGAEWTSTSINIRYIPNTARLGQCIRGHSMMTCTVYMYLIDYPVVVFSCCCQLPL